MANPRMTTADAGQVLLSAPEALELRRLLQDAHRGVGALADRVVPEDRAYVSVPRAQLTLALEMLDAAGRAGEKPAASAA